MKVFKVKFTFVLLSLLLLLSSCMPDSLSKWDAEPPTLIDNSAAPTFISFTQSNYSFASNELIQVIPINDGENVSYAIARCAADPLTVTTSENCTPITEADLPTGLSFSTSTGILSGHYSGTTLPVNKTFYRVTVSNTNGSTYSYFSLEIHAPISSTDSTIKLVKGTHLILTINQVGIFDINSPDENKHYIIAQNEIGKAKIDHIISDGTNDTLYVTLTEDGFFPIGGPVDAQKDVYTTPLATVNDMIIVLPTDHYAKTDVITISTQSTTPMVWNSNPPLPTAQVVTNTMNSDGSDAGTGNSYTLITLKGFKTCEEDVSTYDSCLQGVKTPIQKTDYKISITPAEDPTGATLEITLPIEFAAAPKGAGFGQYAVVRVKAGEGKKFDAGDMIKGTTEINGTTYELSALVVGVYGQDDGATYDNLIIKIFSGVIGEGMTITNTSTGEQGVTLTSSDADNSDYEFQVAKPFTAAIATSVDAVSFYNNNPYHLIYVTDDTPSTDTSTPNSHWMAQAYNTFAANFSTRHYFFLLRTEMNNMMDNNTTSDLPSKSNMSDNYFNYDFRDLTNSEIKSSDDVPTFIYNPYSPSSDSASADINGFAFNNMQLLLESGGVDKSCSSADPNGKVFRILDSGGGEYIDASGDYIGCNGNYYRVQPYEINYDGVISTSDSVTKEFDADIKEIVLENRFIVYNNMPATLLFDIAQGSRNFSNSALHFEITPALPKGLTLLDDLHHIYASNVTAPAGITDHTLTIYNPLGTIKYHFSIEVVEQLTIRQDLANVQSYILHKEGKDFQRHPCRLTKKEIENGQSTLCFQEAGEEELHQNGVGFNFSVSPGLCNTIRFTPYFYFRAPYVKYARFFPESENGKNNVYVDSSKCTSCDGGDCPSNSITDELNNLNLTDPAETEVINEEGLNTEPERVETFCGRILPGYAQSCGTVNIEVKYILYNEPDTDGDCKRKTSTQNITCQNSPNLTHCLGGVGVEQIKDNSDINLDTLDIFSEKIYGKLYTPTTTPFDNTTAYKGKYNGDLSTLGSSNRYYANFTTSNNCYDDSTDAYTYFWQSWSNYAQSKYFLDLTDSNLSGAVNESSINIPTNGSGTNGDIIADTSKMILDPWKGASPFYKYECLDSAGNTKATIYIAVRDWDNSFKAQDHIDYINDPNNFRVDAAHSDYVNWDDSYPYVGDNDTTTGAGVKSCSATDFPEPDNDPNGDGLYFDWDIKYITELLTTDGSGDDAFNYYQFPKDDDEASY